MQAEIFFDQTEISFEQAEILFEQVEILFELQTLIFSLEESLKILIGLEIFDALKNLALAEDQ